ncbi:MAG: polyprenyl synthetase family protein [Candidatus Cryptobacteroides sp.]
MIKEARIESALKEMFEKLKFTESPEGLYDPLRYMIEIGGKRVRPRLCLLTYALFNDEFCDEILKPATALEVFHSFTLIHDDIMDKAPVRRGVPTVYKKWDDNTAILSGDVMSIESYKLIANAPAKVLREVLDLFSTTAAQVCEGQQYDLDFEHIEQIPMADYMKMIGLKTAVLIACAAQMGAIIGGAGRERSIALYDYGFNLGMAFQIADDYLDTYGDSSVFGKEIGGDIVNNKKTWLLTRALEKAAECGLRDELLSAMQLPVATAEEKAEKIAAVKALYGKLDMAGEAREEITDWHSRAMGAAKSLNLGNLQVEMLQRYADNLLGRTK